MICDGVPMADVPLELQESRVFQLRLRNNDLHRIPDAKLSGSGELSVLDSSGRARLKSQIQSICLKEEMLDLTTRAPPQPPPYHSSARRSASPNLSAGCLFIFPSQSLLFPPSLPRDLWQIPLVLKSRGCSH